MEIKFKQNNDTSITIIGIENGEEREIGNIHTPSSSSQNIKNAIQICGFEEAFDIWGCARYVTTARKPEDRLKVIETGEDKLTRTKDIQLLFNFDTEVPVNSLEFEIECFRCFNKRGRCTCENVGKKTKRVNPFNIKLEEDLNDRLEYVDKEIARYNNEINKP